MRAGEVVMPSYGVDVHRVGAYRHRTGAPAAGVGRSVREVGRVTRSAGARETCYDRDRTSRARPHHEREAAEPGVDRDRIGDGGGTRPAKRVALGTAEQERSPDRCVRRFCRPIGSHGPGPRLHGVQVRPAEAGRRWDEPGQERVADPGHPSDAPVR